VSFTVAYVIPHEPSEHETTYPSTVVPFILTGSRTGLGVIWSIDSFDATFIDSIIFDALHATDIQDSTMSHRPLVSFQHSTDGQGYSKLRKMRSVVNYIISHNLRSFV